MYPGLRAQDIFNMSSTSLICLIYPIHLVKYGDLFITSESDFSQHCRWMIVWNSTARHNKFCYILLRRIFLHLRTTNCFLYSFPLSDLQSLFITNEQMYIGHYVYLWSECVTSDIISECVTQDVLLRCVFVIRENTSYILRHIIQ